MSQNNIENALKFCSKYIMLKTLTNMTIPTNNINQTFAPVSSNVKKNVRSRFENPIKKMSETEEDIETERKKTKRRKFQDPVKSNNFPAETQKEDDKSQYVPISNLLANLQGNSNTNSHKNQNNFASFGTKKSSFNFNQNLNSQLYQNNNYSNDWLSNNYTNTNTKSSSSNIKMAPSQFSYESPNSRITLQSGNGFCIPRSRSRSPLGNSQSCSNLSLSPQSRTNQSSVSRRKRKGEDRSFFIPSIATTKQQSNLEVSRVTSNNMLARFQKQIMQEINSPKIAEKGKSRVSETRYETRTKKQNTMMNKDKDMDENSIPQLDTEVRQSLSYLSEARGATRPIQIELKKAKKNNMQ